MLSKRKGALILFSILLFFLTLIFLLKLGKPNFRPLPNFGISLIDQDYFLNEDGDTIFVEDLKGNIIIANYMSLDCPGDSCPLDFNLFNFYIYKEIASNDGFNDIKIISVFIDSSDDMLNKIRNFRNFNGISKEKWLFLNEKENPFFKTNFETNEELDEKVKAYGFQKNNHTKSLLIDKEFNVRGMYYTSQIIPNLAGHEFKRITKEISLLLYEYKK